MRGIYWAWTAVILSLACMYQGALVEHMRFGAYPLIFNDDSRQYVAPFLPDRDASRPDDILRDYRRASMPLGYKLLYGAGALAGDPRTLSKFLPYVLLLFLLIATAYTSSRLGGVAAAWGAMGFILSSGVFLDRMAGGNPRAFAFPLLAGMAAALVSGRPLALAALTVLGAAFYPVAAVIGGLTLAVWMFLYPEDRDAAALSNQRRRALLAATAGLSFLLVLPTMVAMRRFGPQMRTSDVAAYPEYGPGGRYMSATDRPPFTGFWQSTAKYARVSVEGTGSAWIGPLRSWGGRHRVLLRVLLGLMLLIGLGILARREAGLRRLLLFPVVMLPVYMLAKAAAPTLYLPQRYVVYLVPVLAVVLVPAALSALPLYFTGLKDKVWARPAAVVLLCSLQFCLLSGRGPTEAGFHIQVKRGEWIYPFLATLPADSVIAGWPGPTSVIDNVPYISARTAFLTFENHEVYYRGYADEMRRRMRALTAAYFAADDAPLLRLRDEFGVTHLIIDKRHLRKGPAPYFKPFDGWAAEAFARVKKSGRGFAAMRHFAEAQVYDGGGLWVLDLRRLS